MYHMVMVVVNNLDEVATVLEAWDAARVPGITILESTGIGKMRQAALRDDTPLMPSLSDLLRSTEYRHRTLFTVVREEAKVDELIEITQDILGDMEEPDNGVIFVLPVSRVVGLRGGASRAQRR